MNPNPRIGLIGHGRFGAALMALLVAHGHRCLTWDAASVIPEAQGAADIDELLARSDLIVVAVPVAVFETVLQDLRPRLGPQHLVMDVCSVKQGPCALMDKLLGDAVPHIGCHPLFGPLSIARAEALRTVLCPSPRHPASVHIARSIFESIGSEVTEQDPASHDRYMALTHAMAFFIARGLLDLGLADEHHWAPPSFAALAASIAAVRADAGHLFNAIQCENPYAAPTRQRLIEALTLIDQQLTSVPARVGAVSECGIPDLGPSSPALREVREFIDEVDRDLVALLQRRRELSLRAGLAKRKTGSPVLDPERETAMLDERGRWAEQGGLPAEGVQAVFRQILAMSRRAQV